MNKSELLESLAQQTGLNPNMLEVVINKAFKSMGAAFVRGERVAIPEFGVFTVKTRNARQGRNPRTGEPLQIPESRNVSFKAAKALKDALNP